MKNNTTISPYSKNFEECLEPKIKNIVKSLVRKGYLTYSSCEGHSIFGRRFVSVAFPSIEEAILFKNKIQTLDDKILSFSIKKISDYSHDSSFGERNILKEIQWLNNLYMRGYEDYYFLEFSIGKNTPPSFKNIKHLIYKFIYKKCVTSKIENYIEEKLDNFNF